MNERNATRILLMGAYGQDNLGDEAILEVHLQQLADHPVTVVSSNPSQTSRVYGVPSVRTYGGGLATAKAFARADLLVYGGGSLLKELPAPHFRHRLVVNLAGLTLASRAMGKKVAFSAMGVERLRTPLSRRLARLAADASHEMLVRDEGSADALDALGTRRRARVVADPAYLLREDDAARIRIDRFRRDLDGAPYVVLNPMRSHEVEQSQGRVAKAFAELADHIQDTSDKRVVWLPFKTRGLDNDVDILDDINRAMRRPERAVVAPLDLRPAEVVSLLAQSDGFVGMRHHGVLLGLVARTPVVAVPYAPKSEHLVHEFSLESSCVRAPDLSPGKLIEAYERTSTEGASQVSACAKPLELMKARARENFDRLRTLATGRA